MTAESELYEDVLQIDVEDGYRRLAYKSVAGQLTQGVPKIFVFFLP